jgi:FkbM family methyltransferase
MLMKLKGFECPVEDIHFYYRYILGLHEPGTTAIIKRTLRPGMTAVDVGAHFGYFTVLFAKYVRKNGRVYAFEPDPRSFQILEQNTKRFENVRRVNAAVFDRGTAVTLYRSEKSSHNSLWPQVIHVPVGSISVNAVRLDKELDRVSPDFVKIDAEGCELEVLESMKGLLARSPNITLLVELSPRLIKQRERRPDNLFRKLLALGFKVHFINENTRKLESVTNYLTDLNACLERHRDWNYVNLLCTRGNLAVDSGSREAIVG